MPRSDRVILSAIHDFQQARQQAGLRQVLARLTGRSYDLLSYDDVVSRLKSSGSSEVGRREIPLDAIVGSVGRPNDFTRDFLPRRDSDQNRWARVRAAVTDPEAAGLAPIRVYKIGDAYFVLDGHHRVSVARQLGAAEIEAYVTEVHTRVPLTASVTPEEVILKAEYAGFLDDTQLDQRRLAGDLSVSEPGQTRALLDHIEAHRQIMAERSGPDPSLPVAAEDWYDQVYLPVVQVIREQGLQRDFPGCTEADLFLLVATHRAELEDALGWSITPQVGASSLAAEQAQRRESSMARAGRRLWQAVVPDELKDGPAAGVWRLEKAVARYTDRLFQEILVPISGEPQGWQAFEQALSVARRERAQLNGLHVVASDSPQLGPAAEAVRAEFQQRCQSAGVPGSLAIEVGEVAAKINERAALADLVMLNLVYPPPTQPFERLGSGIRTVIRRCPRPILAVPQSDARPTRALLAYDGSPKSEEALFVAAYLADAWQAPLVVVCVLHTDSLTEATVAHARDYLQLHDVDAAFVVREQGSASSAILAAAAEHESNLIICGGYGASPVVEAVVGSTVDQLLREARRPVLICR